MTEGPWDGSDLPPEAVMPAGGGGGPVTEPDFPLDPRERTAHPPAGHDHHVDEWPDLGVKPALGGFTI